MRRWVAVVWVCLLAGTARADAMDPALSRLRIPPGEAGCPADGGYCPDQELFERLVSELAVSATSPVTAAAHTGGYRGTYVGLSTTATRISSDELAWLLGSQGSSGQEGNPSPASTLLWHRLEVRKGLPFGVELGGSVGHGGQTSLWTFGAQLKVALVEGFRRSLRYLPDISVRLTWDVLVGSPQLSATVTSLDLVVSRPFLLGHGWRIAPLLGGQLSIVGVSSGLIDLTPAEDAFADCRPTPDGGTTAGTACTGDGRDLANDVTFDAVQQTRFRLVGGAVAEFQWLRLGLSGHLEPAAFAPRLDAARRDFGSSRVAWHVALALSAGVVF